MELTDNKYKISGLSLLALSDKYGTPVYVYDTEKIKQQYEQLLNVFKNTPIKIRYACKALTNLNILKFLKNLGSGLDTVSIQEVELGMRAGYDPKDIIFTPNGVSIDEINAAAKKGITINIDNISILEQFGNLHGGDIPVCILINPHIMAGGNYQISTGHIDSKFGISVHQMRHVERIVKSTGMKVNGLHMHTGSEILDIDVFIRGVDILFEATQYFKDLEFIDLGSGFKVAYSPNHIPTDIETLGDKLEERFKNFCRDYGEELELWF